MVESKRGPLELMVEAAGLKPSVCSCETCRKKCSEVMCFGTPGDILNLINAGYRNFLRRISVDLVMVLQREAMKIEMVQLKTDHNGCVMYEGGKCLLHDTGLKPSEGKYFIHPQNEEDVTIMNHLMLSVALEWAMPYNEDKVRKCLSKYD